MSKGPKQENYEVSPETKALAAIFAREEKDWQQKWSGVHQQRMEDSAQNNYATILRGRAKKASADALRDIPMTALRNPNLTADYASNAINMLKEANKKALGFARQEQVGALSNTLGMGSIASQGLSQAAKFEDASIFSQLETDMKINTARSGITKSFAKAAGGFAGGKIMDTIAGDPPTPTFNFTINGNKVTQT
tara:strand:+ start:748 stop:1329 length:582 start_codon:yes stop_codon:yes gene_type:complete